MTTQTTSQRSRKTKDKTHPSEDTFAETAHDIKEKLTHAEDMVVDYVKQNPIKAMGFTLLAGVLFAQLMRLRK